MKAVLVIDVPNDMRIKDTKALQITLFNGLFTRNLSINQQLRPLPQREETNGHEPFEVFMYREGWNRCLEAITGETE